METSSLINYLMASMFFITSYLLALMLAGWMFKRAIQEVVEIFRHHGAVTWTRAKTIHELELAPRSILQRVIHVKRDYKPQALQYLVHQKIVRRVGDDRMYLSEKDFSELMNRVK